MQRASSHNSLKRELPAPSWGLLEAPKTALESSARTLSGPQEGSKRGPSEPLVKLRLLEFKAKTASALLGCLSGPLRKPRRPSPGRKRAAREAPVSPLVQLRGLSPVLSWMPARKPLGRRESHPLNPRTPLVGTSSGPQCATWDNFVWARAAFKGSPGPSGIEVSRPAVGHSVLDVRLPLFLLVLVIPLFLLATPLSSATVCVHKHTPLYP